MVVLTLAFAGVALSLPLLDAARWPDALGAQVARGAYRFALVVLTPAWLLWWLGAGPIARRVGAGPWLRGLGGVGAAWAVLLGLGLGGAGGG